eukprot:GHRR01004701.1.p1 GENE.GHRR01004701.1~~GHRR01004701.1.p1  ORF type:complete len:731 (+),score=198.19 GHRR01004701.1:818-3010(+)
MLAIQDLGGLLPNTMDIITTQSSNVPGPGTVPAALPSLLSYHVARVRPLNAREDLQYMQQTARTIGASMPSMTSVAGDVLAKIMPHRVAHLFQTVALMFPSIWRAQQPQYTAPAQAYGGFIVVPSFEQMIEQKIQIPGPSSLTVSPFEGASPSAVVAEVSTHLPTVTSIASLLQQHAAAISDCTLEPMEREQLADAFAAAAKMHQRRLTASTGQAAEATAAHQGTTGIMQQIQQQSNDQDIGQIATRATVSQSIGKRYARNRFVGASGSAAASDQADSSITGAAAAAANAGTASTDASAESAATTQQPPFRIIGGVEAPRDRYKWACSLRASNDFHYCGCSLISPNVIMTAAHCLSHDDPALNTPYVEIGRYYLTGSNNTAGNDYDRMRCKKSVVHSGWSFNTGLNDIALCFLPEASRFSPVNIAPDGTNLLVGKELTVMGWGAESEGASNAPKLMEVTVDATDLASCNKTYDFSIKNTQICAGLPEGGADACQGDSGGPLFVPGTGNSDDMQVGIVSYGVGCGRPRTPGVYTDVSKYRGFIAQQMLANGVQYDPITKGHASTAISNTAADDGQDSNLCACSTSGWSGSTLVGLSGCKQHGLDHGDSSYYCYAQGGRDCSKAAQSAAYPGAAWLDCTPNNVSKETAGIDAPAVTATAGPNTTVAPASGSSSSSPGSTASGNATTGVSNNGAGVGAGAIAGGVAQAVQALEDWIHFNTANGNGNNTTNGNK